MKEPQVHLFIAGCIGNERKQDRKEVLDTKGMLKGQLP
jgi:hypothetical protein